LEGLGDGEGAMLDQGYAGIRNDDPDVPIILPFKAVRGQPLTEEQKAYNRVVASHRIEVEHPMARRNRFTVLRQVVRVPKRESHGIVVRVVATLVNRRITVRSLKTYAA
jgi:hypothetical protein